MARPDQMERNVRLANWQDGTKRMNILTSSFRSEGRAKTILVAGATQCGTSKVVSLLRDAGIFMGERILDATQEDAELLNLLSKKNNPHLLEFINNRNLLYPIWGFKCRRIHEKLSQRDMTKFRNLHIIIVYQDPVSVAESRRLGQGVKMIDAVVKASKEISAQAEFFHHSPYPIISVSYETLTLMPDETSEDLFRFCGI